MAKQTINIGTAANDGTGDPLRTAFTKTNANFTEIYNAGLIPTQTGNNAKYLSTDGTTLSWAVPFSGSYADLTNKPTIPETVTNQHNGSSTIVVGQQNATRDNLSVRVIDNSGSLDVQFNYNNPSINVSIVAYRVSPSPGNILSGVSIVNQGNTNWQLVQNLTTLGDTVTFVISDLSFHKVYRVTVIARNMQSGGTAGDAYCIIEELQ